MTNEQEKYLLKRLEDIRSSKTEEIKEEARKEKCIKFGMDIEFNTNYNCNPYYYRNIDKLNMMMLRSYIKNKGKENLKLKRKITPKFIHDLINSNKNVHYILLEIFDLSEFEKELENIENKTVSKVKKLNETIDKCRRDIILKNECNEILELIKDLENFKI